MVIKKGTIESEGYNVLPVIPGNKKVWFLNGDLVRVHHLNKSNGIMSVYNITKDQIESCLISDFKNKLLSGSDQKASDPQHCTSHYNCSTGNNAGFVRRFLFHLMSVTRDCVGKLTADLEMACESANEARLTRHREWVAVRNFCTFYWKRKRVEIGGDDKLDIGGGKGWKLEKMIG